MKTMSCNQLGGACDQVFQANTFEEIAELSKQHALEMFEQQDTDHLEAMEAMRKLMESQEEMNNWLNARRAEFDALPDE